MHPTWCTSGSVHLENLEMWETTAKLHLISSLLIGLRQWDLPPTWLTKSKPSEHKAEPIIKLYIVSIFTMMRLNLELGFTIKKKSYYLNKVKEIKVLSHEGRKSCDFCMIYHT